MPKLHLKRTPEEEAARQWRKKEKKESRKRRKLAEGDFNSSSHNRRRTSTTDEFTERKWDSDDDEFIGPKPGSSSSSHADSRTHAHKPDYDSIRAELEEQRFREKMAMAFEDDERLDSVEARFNSFTHVPMHWGGSADTCRPKYDDDGFTKLDPMKMDEEEYTEWIRQGMYRKTHAKEYEEKERKKTERAAKRAQEKAIHAETERLERAAADEHRRKKQERESLKWDYAREEYHLRWQNLLSATQSLDTPEDGLTFSDIPWPIVSAHRQRPDKRSTSASTLVSLEDLTRDAISAFLFPSSSSVPETHRRDSADSSAESEKTKKDRKEKLRETFLRFHPDKFEGRLMPRVRPEDQDKVRRGLGNVVHVLNDLMGEG